MVLIFRTPQTTPHQKRKYEYDGCHRTGWETLLKADVCEHSSSLLHECKVKLYHGMRIINIKQIQKHCCHRA